MKRFSEPLRNKLPSLFLEAFSVVLAVLLALAVDQWREDRANAALAQLAADRIESEVRANRQELSRAAGRHGEIYEDLETSLEQLPERGSNVDFEVNFAIAVLSSSAWETSRATRAVHHMDFDWVLRIAKVYDLQSLYLDSQREVVRHISTLGAGGAEPGEILQGLLGRIATVRDLERGLLAAYDEVLAAPPPTS